MSRKNGEARNHHWVSQCYLKFFATPVSRSGKLFVVDLVSDKSFTTIPRNVAAQRDFNRIDIPGQPPNLLETEMSTFESAVGEALLATSRAGKFPGDETRNVLLSFIALLAVRNPRFREIRRKFAEDIATHMAGLMVSTEERFNQSIGKAIEAGAYAKEEAPTYEDMKKFVEDRDYTIAVPREVQIMEEIDAHMTVLQSLLPREWLFVQTIQGEPFVTTDHPVLLKDLKGDGKMPLGFGMAGIDVIFPVTQTLLAVGGFERTPGQRQAKPHEVATLNSEIMRSAERQVYAPHEHFKFRDFKADVERTGKELAEIMRSKGQVSAPSI